MISKICPRSYKKYCSLPLFGPIMNEFITWLNRRGYTIGTIRKFLEIYNLKRIVRFFHRHGIQSLNDLTHDSFRTAWVYYSRRKENITKIISRIELFLDDTRGLTLDHSHSITPINSELNCFTDYLRNVRGLAICTIKSYVIYLKEFLIILHC